MNNTKVKMKYNLCRLSFAIIVQICFKPQRLQLPLPRLRYEAINSSHNLKMHSSFYIYIRKDVLSIS